MHKLLPFRQYDEKDVFNLFSLDISNASALSALVPGGLDAANFKAANWSGTGVKLVANNTKMGDPEPDLSGRNKAYLGAIGSADQGFALKEGAIYPNASGQVEPSVADNTDFFGITLRATLAFDENDEKLLYYQEKLDELQCVLPEQPVPIATRGFFTLKHGLASTGAAIDSCLPGDGIACAADGKFTDTNITASHVGITLATGGGSDPARPYIAMVQFGAR